MLCLRHVCMKAKIKEGCRELQGCEVADWFSVWGTSRRERRAREKSDGKTEHEEGADRRYTK